jgi:hypothetical protein
LIVAFLNYQLLFWAAFLAKGLLYRNLPAYGGRKYFAANGLLLFSTASY